MKNTTNITDLAFQVAEQTLRWPFQMWSFGEAVAIDALLEFSEVSNDDHYATYVYALLLASCGAGKGKHPNDHLVPGRALIKLFRSTEDERFINVVKQLIQLHRNLPTTPSGALLVRAHQAGWAHQIWVDSVDVTGPLFAHYSKLECDDLAAQHAVDLTLNHIRHLQSDSGLMNHGFDVYAGCNGVNWARGQGWALCGIADVLANTDDALKDYNELKERYNLLADAVIACQANSGLWHTIVDDPTSYEETTLPALISKAHSDYKLDNEKASAAVLLAEEAVLANIDGSGVLNFVSSATPVAQPSVYATRPFGNYPWGQGPLLSLLSRKIENEN